VLAAYVLTSLIDRPGRLVYLSSGMHRGGTPSLDDVEWTRRRWNGSQAYSDTKLFDVVLAFGIARRWPGRGAAARLSRRPRVGPGLPVAPVDDLVEGAAVGVGDRLEGPVSRIAEGQHVGACPVVGYAEDAPAGRLVANGRVA
jgi:hypothetical protein